MTQAQTTRSHTRAGRWRAVLAGAVVCSIGLAGCGQRSAQPTPSAALSQPDAAAPAAVVPTPAPAPGGWAPADTHSEEVQEAARFAVQAYAVAQHSRTLYKDVVDVQRQVVAGVNFKMTLQVQHDGKPRVAQVTVWRQLDGAYQLSDWAWRD